MLTALADNTQLFGKYSGVSIQESEYSLITP